MTVQDDTAFAVHPHELRGGLHPLTPRIGTVLESTRLCTNLQRLVVEIDHPETFYYLPMAVDDHVKLFFPDADDDIIMPVIGERGWEPPPAGKEFIHRDYTVRDYDRAAGRLTLDFVLHDHGVGGSWAAAAGPGSMIGVLGPRGSVVYPNGYPWYLLAADETALPALSRFIEELPGTAELFVFLDVPAGAEVALPARDGISITRVERTSRPHDDEKLAEAVRALTLPDGDGFAWAAGEAGTLKPLRRYLRKEVGMPKERVVVDGYWKAGTANHDHHLPDDED